MTTLPLSEAAPPPKLLTAPFLQLPTNSSIRVVWFTEFAGTHHTVKYGNDLQQIATATTTKLSRTRDDQDSHLASPLTKLTVRQIWRHEAEITGLERNTRTPYSVTSRREDGATISSDLYTLAPKPTSGRPLKILLTSDHQLKPMVSANLQKVVETVGQVDLVLFAGDLVNVADRASEWFDDANGGAFFPALQGQAAYTLEKNGTKTTYRGGAILQNTPMYSAIGNHEVMGRFSPQASLYDQFGNAIPAAVAAAYNTQKQTATAGNQMAQPAQPPDKTWLKNQTFNTDTYEEILTLPHSETGGKRYYAVTFGNIHVIALFITNIWRPPSLAADTQGRYREQATAVDSQSALEWGYGQHIFEAIAKGSPQYQWLEQALQSAEFRQAKYRIVMFHHPPHSLGDNIVPAYTNPIAIHLADKADKVSVRYEYPKKDDYIIRDVVPLLEKAGVQLVFFGHSHLWNRFTSPSKMHFLETSNVGNSYGAYIGNSKRQIPREPNWLTETTLADYAEVGNPNGLEPVVPSIAPLLDDQGKPLPYIASNDITVFSILDTGTGNISSYRFDTREPDSLVVKFDEFQLKPN